MMMFDTEPLEHIIMTSDNVKPVAGQRKARTRYDMSYDYNRRGKSGFLLENLLSLAPDEKAVRPPPGRRGFRDYPEMPRFLFDKSIGRLPQDLELFHAYWLVSDRTKSVFEAVDPAGFAFLACDVRLPNGDYDGPPYWLCDVVRVLDALDEVQSRLTIGIRESKAYSDSVKSSTASRAVSSWCFGMTRSATRTCFAWSICNPRSYATRP